MATWKVISRLSSRLQPIALKLNKTSNSSSSPFLSPLQKSNLRVSRLPVELSSLQSTMPLHNAVASARLVSSLSPETKTWTLVPQGISMPL